MSFPISNLLIPYSLRNPKTVYLQTSKSGTSKTICIFLISRTTELDEIGKYTKKYFRA